MAEVGRSGLWLGATTSVARARTGTAEVRGQKLGAGSGFSAPRSSLRAMTVAGLPSNSFKFEDQMGGRGRGAGSLSGGGIGGSGSVAFGLSSGAAPAVVKVISFGSGGKRATAMAHYVLREDVHLETHDGRMLTTREQVGEEMSAWAADFSDRKESDDVVKVRVWLTPAHDQVLTPVWQKEVSKEAHQEAPDQVKARREAERGELAEVVAAGFAGHRYAVAMGEDQTGRHYADVVTLMVSKNRIVKTAVNEAGEAVEKTYAERLRMISGEKATQGRRALNEASERLIYGRVRDVAGIDSSRIRMQVSLPGHGVSGAQNKLDQLIQKGAEVQTETGVRIGNVADTAKLAKSWKRDMHSHGGRDVMHYVISARASENEDSFRAAVRETLTGQFADHKYTFGIHTNKTQDGRGHIHAHVLVAVKSQSGVRLNPNKDELLNYRQTWASVAQKHGMRIVATQAMTQANTQTYGDRDKAILEVAERPRLTRGEKDQAYARRQPQVVEQARKRIEAAQINVVKVPVTQQQRAQAERSLEEWGALKVVEPFNPTVTASLTRLETSTQRYDLAQREGRLAELEDQFDSKELARLEVAERQAAAASVPETQVAELARQAQLSRDAAILAALPNDSRAMRDNDASPVMTVTELLERHYIAPVMTVTELLKNHSRELLHETNSQFGQIAPNETNQPEGRKMTLSAAKMKTDLAQATEDVTTLSGMLTGVDRLEFDQRATNMLNRMTALTKIQGFIEENNRSTITRAEVFELAGPVASEMIDEYQQANAQRAKEQAEREAVEQRAKTQAEKEAVAARVSAHRLTETVQHIANSDTKDPASISRENAEKRVMRDADRLAKDARELTAQERADAEFERITNDPNLTYMQKIAALQTMKNPAVTFDPEKHVNQKPLSPTEQILEHVRQNPHLEEEIARRRARDYSQER